jgi:hypothetical protein
MLPSGHFDAWVIRRPDGFYFNTWSESQDLIGPFETPEQAIAACEITGVTR